MVFDHRTIAIESMVLQSTIGGDGFSMVNEKKRQWFSKIAIYDKKLLLKFKLPTQYEIAQSYQEHHALLPHAMWTCICQNWDLNLSKWGPILSEMRTFSSRNGDPKSIFFRAASGVLTNCSKLAGKPVLPISKSCT